jgi:hypothetical protein
MEKINFRRISELTVIAIAISVCSLVANNSSVLGFINNDIGTYVGISKVEDCYNHIDDDGDL